MSFKFLVLSYITVPGYVPGESMLRFLLAQDHDVSGCHSKYSFFLHCGNDYGAEALRGHGGLDDVGVLPAGFVQDSEVVAK